MNGNKKIKGLLAVAFFALASVAFAVTDVYSFTMNLQIPQVVNNSESMGKRVYKRQKLTGTLLVKYFDDDMAEVTVTNLVNKSFKAFGKNVTYDTETYYTVWNLIGNNATGVFKQPSVHLEAEAQPSYVAGYEPDNDNSLIISLSGKGSSKKRMTGYVTGTLGCGCTVYGHKSPTRVMGAYGPLPIVHDVASIYGTWTAKLKNTICD